MVNYEMFEKGTTCSCQQTTRTVHTFTVLEEAVGRVVVGTALVVGTVVVTVVGVVGTVVDVVVGRVVVDVKMVVVVITSCKIMTILMTLPFYAHHQYTPIISLVKSYWCTHVSLCVNI